MTSVLTVAQWSCEKTSYGLDRQEASRPPSVDSEAVPGGEQALPQGRPRRSDPALSAVREGDLTERLHQQDDRGLVYPPCKVHGKLVHWWTSGAVSELIAMYERVLCEIVNW